MIVLTGDHGLKIEGGKTSEIYYPRRVMQGPSTFRVSNIFALSKGVEVSGEGSHGQTGK